MHSLAGFRRAQFLPRKTALFAAGVLAFAALTAVSPPAEAASTSGFFTATSGRLMDTRTNGGAWAGGTWHTISPSAQFGVPTAGVTALQITVTSIGSASGGYVSTVANGAPQQHNTAALDWNSGDQISNSAIAATDGSGSFQLYVSSTTQLLVDVQGFFATSGSSTSGGFTPLPNGGSRIFDSRVSGATSGHINPATTYTVSGVTSNDGVPSNATALFANITVKSYSAHDSFITPWPSGANRPSTSLNFLGGASTALGSTIGLNTSGQFSIFVGAGATDPVDVIIDIEGYFTSATTPGAFTAQNSRVFDSRATQTVKPNTVTKVQVAGLGGIPTVVGGTAAEAVNVEALSYSTTDGGWLRLWGTNQAEPAVSDVNLSPDDIRSNLAMVVPGSDNSIFIRYQGGSGATPINVVLDVEGWFASSSAATVPGAPQSITATGSDSTATVSFSPPTSDGGSPITAYTVTASPNGQSVSSTGSPIVISNLNNGTNYTFTVAATNAAGTGLASNPSNPVTPAPVINAPSAPLSVSAVGSSGAASVSFSPPMSNGGSPITGYTVTSSPGGITVKGTKSPITVSGLTNGTTYTFTVTASNQAGTGAASHPSNRVTPMAKSSAYPCLNTNHCWGVDTVDEVDSSAVSDVTSYWGRQPDFAGQYLNGRGGSGVSPLSHDSGAYLHSQNIGVLVIEDEGVCDSSSTGKSFAVNAAGAANKANIPVSQGIFIFLDVEQGDAVTSDCISSYVSELTNHGYEPGFYENPTNGAFASAYCSAAPTGVDLWSSEPSTGNTSAASSPTFNPDKPSCSNNTVALQYALTPNTDHNYDEDEIAPDQQKVLW